MRYRLFGIILLLLTISTGAQAQGSDNLPTTVSQLKKWEKEMKQKAANGDANACRLLFLSNRDKYSSYGLQAAEIYGSQKTGEAYYHLAEIFSYNVERRDSLLRLSSQMGYAKATEQIEALAKSTSANTSAIPMRDIALDVDASPTDADFYLKIANDYEKIGYRREAIWYYALAYELAPEKNMEAKESVERLRNNMRSERENARHQLREEQIQREINSMQWQQLANAASSLAASLQDFRSSSATSYQTQQGTAQSTAQRKVTSYNSTSSGSSSYDHTVNSRRSQKTRQSGLWSSWSSSSERKEVKCRTCGGTGKVACHWCNGKTRVTCPGCHGYGDLRMIGFKNRICTTCNGKATIRCNGCYGKGTEKCISCNGKGVVKQ